MGLKAKMSLRIEIPFLTENPLRHLIEVELDLDLDRGTTVRGKIPEEFTIGPQRVFVGKGKGLLGAMVDWLKQVDSSVEYLPAHCKVEDEKRRQAAEQRLKEMGLWPML
ncbi:MAG: hypothetical protein A2566_03170 [Candidatus Zambryskibacteria bacterium RIFOXYD1_FULL_40_13]|nr:MAG: hypothetical protein UT25_C0002G0054 [Parcubacteria group bacterium GW2011_GWC1_39_12]KKR19447.1 MAG: hypothetical protein UT49_C0002G0293 [Parcubacteria group bacterium GW2011_GWF1_39_37]KKR35073.1 MAG: hypothetical protein UT68_C0005G0022 [Parcubacteria group bacterium GW2011_GWC2_40_10]KKR52396.1 MAG: hypothetical protein UT89_C0002G0197 [Parcubacteria group bacterium GW2011_GWE1_40_20]KKR65192.1 MAG: hypothetical protein UU06_C0026G0003 [Parcubacteria group bacterium GW2011_GWB1_40_